MQTRSCCSERRNIFELLKHLANTWVRSVSASSALFLPTTVWSEMKCLLLWTLETATSPLWVFLYLSYSQIPSECKRSRYSRKSSAGTQAMCVCCLTAALIRPLWVRLIGPVIRDAALPPSPARWITSHCRLLRFQDKWTEGESITPQEGEGERELEGGENTLQRYWWEHRSRKGGKKVKKAVKVSWKKESEGALKMEWIASDLGRKRREGEKRRCAGDSCWVSPLPCPSPPHRLGVRVWAFLCRAVSRLFVTVSDLMRRWINHAEAPWVGCTVYMCLSVSEHATVFVHVHTWTCCVCSGGRKKKTGGRAARDTG